LQTEIDGRRYVADAGFGAPGPLTPLLVDSGEEQAAPNGTYRVTDDPATGEKVVERRTKDGWFPLYGFDDAHVGDMDIKAANYLCANWKEAPFVNHLMINGYDGAARIGIFDRAVTIETSETAKRREFADFLDFTDTLVRRLGLKIDDETLHFLWERTGRFDDLIDSVV